MKIISPAYLCITPDTLAQEKISHFIQSFLCSNGGCATCTTCTYIMQQKHPSVTWVNKTKDRYTLTDLDDLLHTISFQLEHNTHHFFVFQKSHLLSPICINALLKIVEEPPTGYHFIFATHTPHTLLITLRSRCVVQQLTGISKKGSSFAQYFLQKTTPQAFMSALQGASPSEEDILDLVQILFETYLEKKLQMLQHNEQEIIITQGMLSFLEKTLQQPLMPGSAKIFLRDLYLHKDMLERRSTC